MLGAVLTNNSNSFSGRFSDGGRTSARKSTTSGRTTKKNPGGSTAVVKAKPSARPAARTTKVADVVKEPTTATEALLALPQGEDTAEQYLAKLKQARDTCLGLIDDDVLVRHMIRSMHTSGARRFLYSPGIQPALEEIFGKPYMHERFSMARQVLSACEAKFTDQPKDGVAPTLASYGTIEVREFANKGPKYVNNGRMATSTR